MSTRNHWTALRQRKISRRTMLGASAKAGVGAAGLALVGCGDDDEPDAGAVAAERAAAAAEEAAAAAVAAGDARAAESEAAAAVAAGAADAAADAAAAAGEASAAAGEASDAAAQAASAADAAAALAAEAAESEDAANAAAAAEAAAAAAADAAAAASAAGDQAAAAVAAAASEAAEAAAQAARDAAAAVEAGTATAEAAQAAIDEAAEAAAAAAAAAGEASAAAGQAAATAAETAATAAETAATAEAVAEAAAETAAAAVAAAQEAADAAQEAAESAAMAAEDEAPATGPQHGGVIAFLAPDGGILDPAIANHGGTDSIVLPIYDHINYLDNGGVLTSAMAELPEVVDDLTFVYNIKPNVYWQDKAPLNGRQFVAEDAAFGLQRFGQDHPEFIWRDRFAGVDQFEAADELTLRLTLKEPFAPLLTAVGETQMVMVSRDAVEAFGDDGIASNIEAAVGTGGMQHLTREADVQTELERNPNYFRDPLPYFDGLRADWNAWDPAYRAAQYVAGASDFLFTPWLGYPAENEAVRAQVGEENMVEVPMNGTWNNSTYFNTQVEPYTDPRVRRALHLATNREQLFAVAQGFLEIGGPICHAAGVYAWSVDELRQLPGYRSGALREEDLAEGRRLLDASGYDPESVPPMSTGAFYTDRAEVIQQNFAEIGFEVDLEEFTDNEQISRRASGQFSVVVQGLGGAFDPDVLHGTHHTDGGRNYGKFSDPEIDALLEQGRTTIGTENRVAIYDEIQAKLLEEHNPQIYWCWGRPVVGHRPWLKGYGPTNMQTASTYRLYRSWFEGKPGV